MITIKETKYIIFLWDKIFFLYLDDISIPENVHCTTTYKFAY